MTQSFQISLLGSKAFYVQPDYMASTRKDFAARSLPISYIFQTESKTTTTAEKIFTFLTTPFTATYELLQALAGKIALLPSSRQSIKDLDDRRNLIPLDGEWKYKRLFIQADGYIIDVVILGKDTTLQNGRWVLYSEGQRGFYEGELYKGFELKQILQELGSNGLVFNYPGVGASLGLPSKNAMVKAYRAMLSFIQDQKGIGAREIICYGYSMGAGVQGAALEHHPLKKHQKHVLVKKQGFLDLSAAACFFYTRFPLGLGFLVRVLGWNMSSFHSSMKLKIPEIIIQTVSLKEDENHKHLQDSSLIIDDGAIAPEASLGKTLLDLDIKTFTNKLFFGVRENHYEKLKNTQFLTNAIKILLADQIHV